MNAHVDIVEILMTLASIFLNRNFSNPNIRKKQAIEIFGGEKTLQSIEHTASSQEIGSSSRI